MITFALLSWITVNMQLLLKKHNLIRTKKIPINRLIVSLTGSLTQMLENVT